MNISQSDEGKAIAAALAAFGSATVLESCPAASALNFDWIALLPQKAVAGPVLTVLCPPGDNLSIHACFDDLRPGDVLVVSERERSAIALLGDLIGTQLVAHGAAGALVDGPIRDVNALRELGLAVWGRSIRPAGPKKDTFGSIGEDICITGTIVRSGDWIVMDADGVVVLPAAEIGQALANAKRRSDGEEDKRASYRAGKKSLDVLGLREKLAIIRSKKQDIGYQATKPA